MMTSPFGSENYDLGRYMQRGIHEVSNALYPESHIPLRDHSGLYGSKEDRDVESHALRGFDRAEPELEYDEPELDL